MNQPLNITHISAWDDPESQIRFLEDTLHGKDWRVHVAYSGDMPQAQQQMRAARQLYEQRGYLVRESVGSNHEPILELHHLGEGTRSLSVLNEAGSLRGLGKLAMHPSIPLKHLSNGLLHVAKWFDDSLHDPARANGVINMTAEYFLLEAAKVKKENSKGIITSEGTWRSPKNLLQRISGLLFFGQSLLYAFAAKNNDDVALDHLKDKIVNSHQRGYDITDLHFDATTDKEPTGAWHSFRKFLGRYPVQIGAALNDLGMMAYMGHAVAQRTWDRNIVAGKADPSVDMSDPDRLKTAHDYTDKNDWKKAKFSGFWKDIAGAFVSIVAWGLMLLPRKPIDEATRKKHESNVFASAWDSFREDPEHLSGFMTLTSSSLRLMGAQSKGNTNQIIGETIYLGGDVALMFTKNDDYGSEKTKNITELARKIAIYVNELPVVFGPQSQQKFVHDIAEYLKQKSIEELGGKPEKINLSLAELNERADHLTRAVMKKIGARDHLDRIADKTAELANYFPAAQQTAVENAIINALTQLSWVKANPAEIRSAMDASPFIDRTNHTPAISPQTMGDISKAVRELLSVVHGIDMGGSAAAIQHALKPFIGAQRGAPIFAIAPAKPATMIQGPAMNAAMDRLQTPLATEALR